MSKVIKSSILRTNSPKYLEVLPVTFQPQEILPEVEPEKTIDPVQLAEEQAERIMEETRLAVQDLLNKAKEQANAILAEANRQAEEITRLAGHEVDTLRRSQAELGYQEGYKRAVEQAQSQAEAIIDEAHQEAEAARQAKLTYINSKEPEIVELSIQIAEKILQYEIANKPDVVLNIAMNAINKVRDMSAVVLKIHPQDYPLVQSAKPELMRLIKGLRSLTVEMDETVDRGGCIIDTSHGYVDARIEAQLEEVSRVIREVMHS
ncbi:hypothetical protein H1S01_02665 [Heliobacterium chlorum]|uniref:Flagellar assembly protein FliH/Type III secretion system HrpE domain-containing protein n=1 Tax=Heliobacterium chlorum TaxID=2698 RepID=A0ABR7T0P1_HELCL|nr:FliH/SctL family protein [Heliobacterium chlorum]MBC9783414.1 hypothetical protein [Heliobacterium chlorum]